jgi:hypothetical protein
VTASSRTISNVSSEKAAKIILKTLDPINEWQIDNYLDLI